MATRGTTPRWTAQELNRLVAMAGHASNIEIADELGRTKDSVAYQISVRKIRTEAAQNDYKFSSLALAVVNSLPFQMRRTPER